MKKSAVLNPASIKPLKGVKTEWNMSFFYRSINDPQIEKDVSSIEKKFDAFSQKYAEKADYLTNSKKLLAAIKDWEKLTHDTAGKPVWYLHLLRDIDLENSKISSLMNSYLERLTISSNFVLFFELALGKIDIKTQKGLLNDISFKKYHYFLKKIFDNAKYFLSEKEEKILSLKSSTSHRLWVDAQSKHLGAQTIEHRNKKIPFDEALGIRSSLPAKERHALHAKLMQRCKDISFLAEAELVSIVLNKKIDDELRGFKNPEDGTILSYQNDGKSIAALVDTTTKYFDLSKKFYTLKAKALGQKKIYIDDINLNVSKNIRKIKFEEAVSLIRDSFSKADKNFSSMFDSMLKNGQIDVFPKVGKRGGAYCSSLHDQRTMILMNYVNDFRSVETLAHEMGHAIHAELSKTQPPLSEDYTISVAEVASTFFENILFDHVYPTLSEKEKFGMLFSKVHGDMSSIFRQISFFNFEKELHKTIREKGGMSKEEMAAMFRKHLQSYLGPAVMLNEEDGYAFIYVPHFRSFFYVYSYAYGQLISTALYKKYKEDHSFIEKIKKFLSAGGSMSPEDIFKSIGIDTSKPAFFEEGLKSIEEDIDRLEKLSKQLKNK